MLQNLESFPPPKKNKGILANLGFESFFVIDDVSNNLRVEEDDGEHGHKVGEHENEEDEHFRLHGVGEVVKRTAGQVALW